jgi:hypothetical protein
MFSSLHRLNPLLLALALLISACSTTPLATTVPLVPAATSAATAARPTVITVPTKIPAPTATSVPINTPAPTATAAPAIGATCLVGTWEVTDMSDYFAAVMAKTKTNAAIVGQKGQLLYTFTPDGHAAIKAGPFQETVQAKVQGLALDMVITLDGQATSAYTSTPDKITFTNPDNSHFKISATLNGQDMFAGTTPDDLAAAFGVSADPKYNTSSYECDGDTLKITPPVQNAHAIALKRTTP